MQKIQGRYSLRIATGLFLVCVANYPLLAATKVVGNCIAGSQYATIQLAVNASAAGGTVKVCPGNYPEQVVINKSLTLVGIATGTGVDNPVVIVPSGGVVANAVSLSDNTTQVAAQILVQNGSTVHIKTLAVDGNGNGLASCIDLAGVYFQNSSGSVVNAALRNQNLASNYGGCRGGRGVYVQSGFGTGGTATVSITNNSVHDYQKSGILADGDGTTVTIKGNRVVGLGPVSYQTQNGIEFTSGATGTVTNNTVTNDIYTGPNPYGASGILLYASEGVQVTNNDVGSTQFGIVAYTDPNYSTAGNPGGLGDNTLIKGNTVTNALNFDAIEVCSNNNTIQGNSVMNSSPSAIHLDSACGGTGNNNTVINNNINEGCAGILQGGTGNTLSGNSFQNLAIDILAGDSCPAVTAAASVQKGSSVQTSSKVEPAKQIRVQP
jgi:Right handed beta helix region